MKSMFNVVEHTFSDTKLSFHARRKFTYWGSMAYTRPDEFKIILLACLKD